MVVIAYFKLTRCASKLTRAGKDIGNHRLSASMTVEASYIMAIVILALAVLIRTAYLQCGKTVQVMHLHCAVEQLRSREGEDNKMLIHGQVERNLKQVEGYTDGKTWRKEIVVDTYEPEEILRKIAVFEKHNGTEGDQKE